MLTATLDAWWDQSGPVVLGRLVAVAFGAVVAWIWAAVGPVLSAVDFFTRIPPQWSYELAPLVQLRERLMPLGGAIVLLGLVLGIGWGVVGLWFGRPFGRLLSAIPTFLLATGGLLVAPEAMAWWIRFCNAASGALLAPGTGLPALREMEAVDRVSALGVIALVYLLSPCGSCCCGSSCSACASSCSAPPRWRSPPAPCPSRRRSASSPGG